MNRSPHAIELESVCFAFGGEEVLHDISLDIPEGDYLAVLGPNGGGKTTLLKLILGLLDPDSGDISVYGHAADQGGQQLGYVPQLTQISTTFPMKVLDVVLMGRLGVHGTNRAKDLEAARSALERVDMLPRANKRIGELSGGQRQRVYIARALAGEPKALLLDEPTASVDISGKSRLFDMLDELNRSMTLVVVSHDISILHTKVKRVACVNQTLHLHDKPEITPEMAAMMFGCPDPEQCPVELVAHGLPHRVLTHHDHSHAASGATRETAHRADESGEGS